MRFEVPSLFGALRGMLRPLLVQTSVTLVFEEPVGVPAMMTDETKVSQILRNLISNALKYTEHGEVRVSARFVPARDAVVFSVADTGIGIPEEDIDRVFDEFVQIDNPLQRRVKGTGLGLPLSRRLAELLGGSLAVFSSVGVGSTFELSVPLIYRSPLPQPVASTAPPDPSRRQVVVVEDSPADMMVYADYLKGSGFQLLPARTPAEAESLLAISSPSAIILDVRLFGEDSWDFLLKLKQQPATRAIPIVIVSLQREVRKGLALGADAYGVKPITRAWLLDTLAAVTTRPRRVLVIDDEEASRFVTRRLMPAGFEITEAASGLDGVRMASEHTPDVIMLDLLMPDLSGYAVLQRLRSQPSTADIPVIIVSSAEGESGDALLHGACANLNKRTLTREGLAEALADATMGAHAERPV
jgi:CheY-like chemotaxis protein